MGRPHDTKNHIQHVYKCRKHVITTCINMVRGNQISPGGAAGDAFPEVGFLSCELRLHASFHGEFRLTHVGTVPLQLHRAETHELREVVPGIETEWKEQCRVS